MSDNLGGGGGGGEGGKSKVVSSMLSFDMFRVISDTDRSLTQATARGKLISSICMSLLALMTLNEVYLYLRTDMRSSMSVSASDNNLYGTNEQFDKAMNTEKRVAEEIAEAKQMGTLSQLTGIAAQIYRGFKNPRNGKRKNVMEQIHFNVSFPGIPCYAMEYDALDPQTGTVYKEAQKTVMLTRMRLKKGTLEQIAEYDHYTGWEERSHEHTHHEGCMMWGTAAVDKTPGDFLIAVKQAAYRELLVNKDINNECFEYRIHDLWIGDKKLPLSELPDALANPLKGSSGTTCPWNTLHKYYLNIVPTVFDAGNAKKEHLGFQYTQHHAFVTANMPPGLYFHHEHSPITVEYYPAKKSFSHFIVNLCAVIGGVFTVMGFIVPVLDKILPEKSGGDSGGSSSSVSKPASSPTTTNSGFASYPAAGGGGEMRQR